MTEKKKFTKADVFKFLGLIAFFILVGLIVYLLWSPMAELLEEGGAARVIDRVQEAGAWGVLILLGLQFLQIVVAFIPGEVTQLAAGILYGPWLGTLIILIGCIISSAFIYLVVHRLGAPFVHSLVSTKYLEKFQEFEKKGKLKIIVFILFLIPGLPKDVFTYLVPLTDMKMKDFLLISNTARLPAIFVSTFAAAELAEGKIIKSAIIFGVAALLLVIGFIFREKLMSVAGQAAHRISEKLHPKKNDKSDSDEDSDEETSH